MTDEANETMEDGHYDKDDGKGKEPAVQPSTKPGAPKTWRDAFAFYG